MRAWGLFAIACSLSLACSSPPTPADAGSDAAGDAAVLDPNDAGADAPDDTGSDAFVAPDAFVSLCGNGTMDTGEICDDHNTTSGDGCRGDCLGMEACGDGLADFGEYCPSHTSADTAITGVYGGALADGDSDGDVDVYVVLDSHLVFLANDGAGTFAAPHDTGAVEMGLFVDLMGSAEPELVVARGTSLDVLPNTAGSFGAAITSTVPTVNLALGRFDAGASVDFLVSTAASSCAPLIDGGGGHFTMGTAFDCGSQVRQILTGDIDGDGQDDDAAFLHDSATNNVSVVLGDGVGGFGTRSIVTSEFPARGALGDVDLDGQLDVAHGVMMFPVRVEIVRTVAGVPQAPTHVPVTAFPGPVTFFDVDLDGDSDLYNFGFSSGTPYTMLRENDGTGAFDVDLDTGLPNGAQFADMNGDLAIDVVVLTPTAIQIFFANP